MALDFNDAMDLSIFSDLFKDRHGFRPRGMTVAQMEAWMVYPGPLSSEEIEEEEAEYRAQEEAEEAAFHQKRADFDFHPWQVQAGKLRNLPESVILEY